MNNECMIENWIMRNKSWLGFLLAIIVIWIVSVIGIMRYKMYHLGILWYDSYLSLSNIINLGIVIGTISLAVFAWFGYKQQRQNEFIRDNRAEIIKTNLRSIISIITKSNITFMIIRKTLIEEFPDINQALKYDGKLFLKNYNFWINDIDDILQLIINFNKLQLNHTINFAELNLYGINENELKELSACMANNMKCLREYAHDIEDIKNKLMLLEQCVKDTSNGYDQTFIDIINTNIDSFSNSSLNDSFSELMTLGSKIINK